MSHLYWKSQSPPHGETSIVPPYICCKDFMGVRKSNDTPVYGYDAVARYVYDESGSY